MASSIQPSATQCSVPKPLAATIAPPPAAPMAWPRYMAEVFSAISAGASAGAAAPSRACCAEFDEKQPSAHGTSTAVMATTVSASGHSSRLTDMAISASVTQRAAPWRSTTRCSRMLPSSPKAPNHRNRKLTLAASAPMTWR